MRKPLVPSPGVERGLLRNVLDEVASLPRSKIKANAWQAAKTLTYYSASPECGRNAMSAALTLPYIWAESARTQTPSVPARVPADGIAFYRKRTELLLRRYMFVSLQTGRVPSLIGKSVFRGKASSYRMHNFEDAVIFLFDIEKCLKKLDPFGQELIARIALQEYTQEETAHLVGHSVRSIIRKYAETIDTLSRIFLDLELLEID